MKKLVIILFMVSLVSSFNGCIQNNTTIYLTMEDDGSTISINVGDKINITLEETPSTGYLWNITQFNESILNLTKESTWGFSDIIGASINHTWILTAIKHGETTLKISYYRPWEGSENATMNFTIHIKID